MFQIVDHLLGGQVTSVSLPESTDHKKLADDFNEFFINKVDLIHDSIVDNCEKANILNDTVFSAPYNVGEHRNFMLYNNNINDLNVAEHSNSMLYYNVHDLSVAEHSNFVLYNNIHDLNVDVNSNFMLYYDVRGLNFADSSNYKILHDGADFSNNTNQGSHLLYEFDPCTVDELREMINDSGIKVSSADPLPSSILKECVEEVLPYLTILVNSSLQSGSVEGIKESIVRPLLKKAGLDANVFNNYRPISNLSFVSKVVERVGLKRLNSHLEVNNLQCHSKFGYKRNHSTETLLVHFLNDILVAVDKNLGVVVLLIDLSAAFDTINHKILFRILRNEIGIKGTALYWFKSVLSDRSQRVSIGSSISSSLHLKFGVPQGSVLGPVLFNLYTRSISKVFASTGFTSVGYADDNSGLYVFAHHSQYDILMNEVPDCLSRLKSWMGLHFLKLNESKTKIIVFGNNSFLKSNLTIPGTFLNSCQCLRFTDTAKYLGIFFDNYITLNVHINNITSSCYHFIRKLSSIRKFLSQKDCETLVDSESTRAHSAST